MVDVTDSLGRGGAQGFTPTQSVVGGVGSGVDSNRSGRGKGQEKEARHGKAS